MDLTRERYTALKEAREITKDVDSINFVYADINCDLRMFTKEGKHSRFDSIADLENLIVEL